MEMAMECVKTQDHQFDMPQIRQLSSPLSPSDEKLMLRVKEKADHAAFALLVKRWQCPITRLCVRMMTDEQRGEDLAQETFAKIFHKRASYRPTAKFSTYLWRVAMNACYDDLRKRKRQWGRQLQPLDASGEGPRDRLAIVNDTPMEQTARNEEAKLVRQAVAQLPENYRAVLILRHYEGLKLREIADVLEIPLGTVNSRMADALTRLSHTLRPKLSKMHTQAKDQPAAEPRAPKLVPEGRPSALFAPLFPFAPVS